MRHLHTTPLHATGMSPSKAEAALVEAGDTDSHAIQAVTPAQREDALLPTPQDYEATTLGGLVSEIAGHIPLPGEVVERDGLRMEVLASTDRRIDRLRLSLTPQPSARVG